MLALAALTYRGFGSQSESAIAAKLELSLPTLEPEGLGSWQIAWGPETFRAPTSLVDDVMVVALQQEHAAGARPRYAVAIRGTNPVSVFDWVFGDLWVNEQLDWPGAAPAGARLAASTRLGLSLIQSLGGSNLAALGTTLAVALRDFAERIPEIDPQQLLAQPDSFTESDLLARLRRLTGLPGEKVRDGAFERLKGWLGLDAAPRANGTPARRALDLISEAIAAQRAPGRTLLDFLETLPAGTRVDVTGHSKGGALAVATALWLHEAFAAARGIEIRCFSYAGPTAGNAAFARRYDAALGARTRRIVNPLDLVPSAWESDDLRRIGRAVYPKLLPATEALAAGVAGLAYTHVGGTLRELAPHAGGGDLVREIVHQHLDAYLVADGLAPAWSASSIFLG